MPFFPYEVEHTLFDDMATDGMTCLAMTGFSSAHLAYVWNTYGAHLKPVNWRPKAFKCRAGRSYSIIGRGGRRRGGGVPRLGRQHGLGPRPGPADAGRGRGRGTTYGIRGPGGAR